MSAGSAAGLVVSLAWRDLRSGGRFLWIFWACSMLGVALIAASGGLFKQVSGALLADARALFGGDLVVDSRAPLGPAELGWMRERGEVSLLIELRTMMLAGEQPQLVELQSVDAAYPLYGEVELDPPGPLARVVGWRPPGESTAPPEAIASQAAGSDAAGSDAAGSGVAGAAAGARPAATDAGPAIGASIDEGAWGAAIDPVLARRLGLAAGDTIDIGRLRMEVRALIARQPDRSLSADWRGPPVLIASEALAASGLLMPGSRLDYEYRVKVTGDPAAWGEALARAFPEAEFEVRTVVAREGRIAEVLGQIASGLLLIGFSALLVGGLGVFNSVRAYLDTRLATIATLRAVGLRDGQVAAVYLVQVTALAASAALAGMAAGGGLALAGVHAVAERLPVAPDLAGLLAPLGLAGLFGVLTALTFAMPALGRALSVSPAALFRGIDLTAPTVPARWWAATAGGGLLLVALMAATLPQPLFAAGFAVSVVVLLALLEGVARAVRVVARRYAGHPFLGRRFALKLAVANLYRPGAPLRVTLVSLGVALTVLVASAVVVGALLQLIEDTIPERAPALVFYDVSSEQAAPLRAILAGARTLEGAHLAPLVLGRMSHVNGESLRESADRTRALESRDEHKLTHRLGNIDAVTVERGRWWPEDYAGPPLVAFEDREADQLGLQVGDRLRFRILDRDVEAELAAIYSQRGIGTRFWFEGIFPDGALDSFVTRYVGTAYLDAGEAVEVEARVARAMPNVITVRTERILREARAMLGRAAAGLALIALVTLVSSWLVLASVVASSRARQVYDATVLHVLGARHADIRASLALEYLLIAALTSALAIAAGSAIAGALLHWRIDVGPHAAWWLGGAVAVAVSVTSLGLGAQALLRALRISPATLLRVSG